jgi:hypothetical protein
MCYAQKGFYKMYASTILPAQQARLDSIDSPLWVEGMIKQIGKASFFRWHDSGDIQSVEHLGKIVDIAKALPNCKFWLPTRERTIVKDYLKSHTIPANLIVRLSAIFPDAASPTFAGLLTASVHDKKDAIGYSCPAPAQNGSCGDCRACWDTDVQNVSYKLH